MRVLIISIDTKVFDRGSAVQKRIIEYGSLVESIDVVSRGEAQQIPLSQSVCLHGVSGSKVRSLFALFFLGRRLVTKKKIDIISVQDAYYVGFIAYVLSKITGVPLEIQIHGFEKCTGLRAILAHIILKRAKGVRAVSERLKKELVETFRVRPERIHVVPIYTDISRYLSLQRKHRGSPFTFLTVGRLVKVKHIELQIHALAHFIQTDPSAELIVLGEGVERKSLERLALALGIKEHVLFQGHTNVLPYFEKADVFLLTSFSEGWGLSVVEAAAAGLPIIMTDVGCAGEFIHGEENGIVIPVGNGEALLSAMKHAHRDRTLRDSLGSRAKESAKKLPSKEKTLMLYKEGWEKILRA